MNNTSQFYAFAVKDRCRGKKAFFTRIGGVCPDLYPYTRRRDAARWDSAIANYH